MKLYLIDDDKNILNILKQIIRERQLGEICGTASNGIDALEDMPLLHPDMVIVDLLMPEMDGVTFVKNAKKVLPDTAFIMLSQVASKDMIADAYRNGVEFYIQKPINSIEVESIVRRVEQSVNAQRTLLRVQNIFMDQLPAASAPAAPVVTEEKPYLTELKNILKKLGIIGERGSREIIALVEYLAEHENALETSTLNELCSTFSDTPKSVEQRIRRSANAGMVNLANLGLEDYSNDIFITYANTLYNFEQVRKEMDFIRGKSKQHGNIKIKNFLNALVSACTEP